MDEDEWLESCCKVYFLGRILIDSVAFLLALKLVLICQFMLTRNWIFYLWQRDNLQSSISIQILSLVMHRAAQKRIERKEISRGKHRIRASAKIKIIAIKNSLNTERPEWEIKWNLIIFFIGFCGFSVCFIENVNVAGEYFWIFWVVFITGTY